MRTGMRLGAVAASLALLLGGPVAAAQAAPSPGQVETHAGHGSEHLKLREQLGLAPSLFGHEFMVTDAPNRYGLPAFYSLHVWAWDHNPMGTFEMWNPDVVCP